MRKEIIGIARDVATICVFVGAGYSFGWLLGLDPALSVAIMAIGAAVAYRDRG